MLTATYSENVTYSNIDTETKNLSPNIRGIMPLNFQGALKC